MRRPESSHVQLVVKIKNVGRAHAPAKGLDIRFTGRQGIYRIRDDLKPGEEHVEIIEWKLPARLPPGRYTAKACVDHRETIDESHEENTARPTR